MPDVMTTGGMSEDRLAEIEVLHGTEPAPEWAGELLVEVRRLHGRVDRVDPILRCPGCHRQVIGPMDAHLQTHNQGDPT